jgi:uncharacterized protein HemY
MLISFGIILIVFGIILSFAGRVPFLGRLPGDIYIQKKNFTFFFPLATSVVLSVLISVILFLFRKIK